MAINAGSVYATLDLNMSKFQQGLGKAEKQMNTFQSKLESHGKKMESIGKSWTKKVTLPIVGLGAASVKSSIDFESAFAGVRKTIDATESQFDTLKQGIIDMSKELPASATEIAGVAEAAGQLGIKTENILSFTRTMIDLGEATNMSSEEAATSLARLANITGMPQTEFDRLGSTVVDLGNNLATTESEIVEMGLRLAGTGTQIGLTEAQIMAMSGAMSSVGINAEAGGSSMSRVMQKMNTEVKSGGKNLEGFASIAGMTSSEFAQTWQNEPIDAIVAFIEGLDNVNASGGDVTSMLKDLGINSTQEIDTLSRLAGASDVLTESIDIGTNAWEENTALTAEAAERYKTTESQLKIAKNTLMDAGRTIGDIVVPHLVTLSKNIKKVAEWFSNLNPETQETIVKMAGVAAAIGPLLVLGGKLVGSIALITKGFGAVSGALGLASGSAALTAQAVSPLATGIGGAGLAAKASALLLNPWTAAIVTGGVAAYGLGKKLSEDAIPQVELFGDEVSESTQEAVGGFMDLNEQATLQLNQLAWSGQTVTAEMAESLIGQYGEMNNQILTSMRERHTQQLESTQQFFAESAALTEEEEVAAMERLQEYQQQEQTTVQEGQARIAEILNTAKEEKRELKESERQEINEIQKQMTETAVEVMSESEVEQKAIMERLRQSSEDITARQAAEVVKNSAKQKEETIQNANEQYLRTVEELDYLKDEAGAISDEQYKKLKKNAEETRDGTVADAKKMHEDVVSEAKQQAGDHVNEVDWETGEVRSKWGAMVEDVKEKAGDMVGKVKKHVREQREESNNQNEAMRKKANEVWTDMRKKAGDKFEDIKEKISDRITTAKDKWNSATEDMRSKGNSKFGEIQKKVSSAFGTIKDKIGEGISKLQEWNNTKVKDKVATFTQKVKTTGSKILSGLGIGRNARGTNYWRGGLTWVGEQGPELIDLPRGSKVYPNQQSMAMAQGGNAAINSPISLEVPVQLDGREIARATVNFTAQELQNLQNRQMRGRG